MFEEISADVNKPVAYVQGQTVSLTSKFGVNPVPAAPIGNVTITGNVTGLGKCIAAGVTIPTAPTLTVSCTMDHALPANQTKFYNPMTIRWSYSLTPTSPPLPIGSTKNPVYVTLKPPLQYNQNPNFPKPLTPLYRTTLQLAISKGGARDALTAFQNTWSEFSIGGTGPKNIHTWDGRALYYYRNDSTPVGFSSAVCPLSSLDEGVLLKSHNSSGQCTTFAVLLIEALRVNGIETHEIQITATDSITNGTGFLVKGWTFSPTPSGSNDDAVYRWKMSFSPQAQGPDMVPSQPGGIFGDLRSLSTVPGQNSTPPSEKVFKAHYIVFVPLAGLSPSYYDPSYGLTYSDANNFEEIAVDGYLKLLPFPLDSVHTAHARQKTPGSPNILFCNLDNPQGCR